MASRKKDKHLFVFGVRRSGTHILRRLLADNINKNKLKNIFINDYTDLLFDDNPDYAFNENNKTSTRYWFPKHKHETVFYEDLYPFVTIKDIYSWLVSYYKFFYHKHGIKQTFDEFLHSTHSPYEIDKDLGLTPVEKWNDFYNLWLKEKRKMFIKNEDVMFKQKATIVKIFKELGYKLSRPILIEKHVKVFEGSNQKKGLIDKDYYLNKEYLNYFNKSDLKYVYSSVDKKIMKKFGYKLIKP